MDDRTTNDVLDLRKYTRLLRRRAWIVVAIAVVCAGAAFGWSHRQANVFESSAVVRVFDPTLGSTLNQDKVDPTREVQLEVQYATSPEVQDAVNERLSADGVKASSLDASGSDTSDAIKLTATSGKKAVAKQAAETYADVFLSMRRDQVASPLDAQATDLNSQALDLQKQANDLQTQIEAGAPQIQFDASGRAFVPPESEAVKTMRDQETALNSRAASLQSQADQLSLDAANRRADLSLVTHADQPGSPISPKPVRNAAIAFVVGLFLGLLFVIARDRTGGAIDGVADVPADLRAAATVVAVPRYSRRRQRRRGAPATLSSPDSAFAEACREIRSAVLFRHEGVPSTSILVTSAREGDGKTTIAANLAIMLARAGSRVVLVDGDLRQPKMHEAFGLDNEPGLTSCIEQDENPLTVLKNINIRGARGGRLSLLTAGPAVEDPADLLVAASRKDLLKSLQWAFDFVIVDSPPVLNSSDAQTLAWELDGIVLVTRHHKTRRSDLDATSDVLLGLRRPIVAVVVNGASRGRGNSPYPYGDRERSGAAQFVVSGNGHVVEPEPPHHEDIDLAHAEHQR